MKIYKANRVVAMFHAIEINRANCFNPAQSNEDQKQLDTFDDRKLFDCKTSTFANLSFAVREAGVSRDNRSPIKDTSHLNSSIR